MPSTAFLQNPVNETPEPWQQWNLYDFRGGLNSGHPPLSIRDNEFPELSNWLFDEQGNLICRPGRQPYQITPHLSLAANTSGTIQDMHILEKDGKLTLYTAETFGTETRFKKATRGDAFWDTLGTITNYSSNSDILVYGNQNFEDEFIFPQDAVPKRVVTGGLEDLGLQVPTKENTGLFANQEVELRVVTPTGTDAKSRGGIDISGVYYYKLTWYYDDTTSTKFGESAEMDGEYSVTIDIATTDDSKYVEFYGLGKQIGLPTGVTKVNVYRSPAGAKTGPYKWVGSFTQDEIDAQAASVPVFTDTVAIDAEGSEIPIGFADPVACYAPVLIGNTVWAFDSNIEGKLIYSNPGQIDVFPALNFAYLDGKGQAIVEFNRNIYAFTTTGIYVISGGDPSNAPIKLSNLGTSSRDSIAVVGNGLMWLGDDEIYWADFNSFGVDGELPKRVGQKVIDKVYRTPREWRHLAQGAYFENRYYLSLPSTGQSRNTETLAFDLRSKTWSVLNWAAWRFATTSKIMLSAGLDVQNDGLNYIYEHDQSFQSDVNLDGGNLIPIATSLRTKPMFFGHESAKVLINSTTVMFDGRATDAVFSYIMPEQAPVDKTVALGSASSKAYLYWAANDADTNSDWDETYWFDEESFVSKRHFKVPHNIKGDTLALKVTLADAGGTSLLGLSIYYESLRPPA